MPAPRPGDGEGASASTRFVDEKEQQAAGSRQREVDTYKTIGIVITIPVITTHTTTLQSYIIGQNDQPDKSRNEKKRIGGWRRRRRRRREGEGEGQ